MPELQLNVLSLRYSSWSMRAWLALQHAGARFSTKTVELPEMTRQASAAGELEGDMSRLEAPCGPPSVQVSVCFAA